MLAFLFHQSSVPLKSVLLEKLLFITSMIWFLVFSARMLLTTDFSEYRERQLGIDAEDYMSRLGDGPFRRSSERDW